MTDLHGGERRGDGAGSEGDPEPGHFPSDEAATKLIYLALRNIQVKWKRPPKEWHAAKTQIAVNFGDRFIVDA